MQVVHLAGIAAIQPLAEEQLGSCGGAMPHGRRDRRTRSKPAAARLAPDVHRSPRVRAAALARRASLHGALSRRRGAQASRPAAARTYGRMPPWRNATSSSGVSMRAVAVMSWTVPSAQVTRTVTTPRGCSVVAHADDVEALAAGDLQRRGVLAVAELQRQHAHVHQVAAVDALEALRDHRLHAEQQRALSPPSRATIRTRTPCRR